MQDISDEAATKQEGRASASLGQQGFALADRCARRSVSVACYWTVRGHHLTGVFVERASARHARNPAGVLRLRLRACRQDCRYGDL